MKMSRRALALTVATTISVAGMAMPAHAKGGPNGGGDSSSSSVAPQPAPAPTEPAASTPPSSIRGRTSTSAKAPEAHESEPEHPSESSAPKSSAPVAGAAGTTATTARKSDDKARDSIEVIDNMIRRLKASSKIDPAVRDGLVSRLLDMKASFAAGQAANPGALQVLAGEVRAALGSDNKEGTTVPGGSTSSTTPEKEDESEAGKEQKKQKGKAAHARATDALQAEIAKVAASNLPDDVKAKVIGALTEAQQNVASHVDAADAAKEVHDTLEAQRADKFAKMQQRLAGMADRVQAAIDKAAATPGNEALVAFANTSLVDARAKLAAATTTADLKLAWQLMRDIRKSLPHVELPEPTTTVATAPSTTVAATPGTTAAPAVDTTVATGG